MQILEQRVSARREGRTIRNKVNSRLRQRDWIEERVLEYLKRTPCAKADRDKMPQLVNKFRLQQSDGGFGLTDAETLQVLNFMPQESVEIHFMIADLPTRISEKRQEELLETVGSCLANKKSTALEQNIDMEEVGENMGEGRLLTDLSGFGDDFVDAEDGSPQRHLVHTRAANI
jgi:hypothetical protein